MQVENLGSTSLLPNMTCTPSQEANDMTFQTKVDKETYLLDHWRQCGMPTMHHQTEGPNPYY